MKTKALRCLLVALVLLVSSFCFLYGAIHTVPNATYTGIRSLNASDINVNLSWIEQYREGALLLRNPFTSEPQKGASFRLSYLLLSQPFRIIHVSNAVAYHAQRIFVGAVLLLALFGFLKAYLEDERSTWIAFLFLCFTSGIGFLVRTQLPESSDLSIPESNLFLSLGEAPHFLFSLLFLWLGIASFYRATVGHRKGIVIALASLLVLWWDHPFDAFILAPVCLANVWQLPLKRDRILFVAGCALISIPAALYYQWLKSNIGFSTLGTTQNLMLSPSPGSLLSGLLPLVVLSVPAAIVLWRDPEKRRLLAFLSLWIGVQLLLAYAPVPFQRRLVAGIQFPLVLLAAHTLRRISFNAVIVAIILLCSLGSFWIMSRQTLDIATGGMPFYLPNSYVSAFNWLRLQKSKDTILSGFFTGNFIPGYTGFTSYVGHSSLTVNAREKRRNVENFYRNPNAEFLAQNGIRLMFWGIEERHLSDVKLESRFQPLYSSGGIWILKAR